MAKVSVNTEMASGAADMSSELKQLNLSIFDKVGFGCTDDSNESQEVIHIVRSPINLIKDNFGSLSLFWASDSVGRVFGITDECDGVVSLQLLTASCMVVVSIVSVTVEDSCLLEGFKGVCLTTSVGVPSKTLFGTISTICQ